eukprot:1509818-Pyramimonas_sp.AAC.1
MSEYRNCSVIDYQSPRETNVVHIPVSRFLLSKCSIHGESFDTLRIYFDRVFWRSHPGFDV